MRDFGFVGASLGEDSHLRLRRALAAMISDISEYDSCASWLMGIEYALWQETAREALLSAESRLSREERNLLWLLSLACGGWVEWRTLAPGQECLLDGSDVSEGVVFVPMAEWLVLFEKGYVDT